MPTKKGKLNLEQIEDLKGMSLGQLQGSVEESMKSRNQPQESGAAAQAGGAAIPQPADPTGGLVPYDEDAFIQKYLDPATLEERPEYANGTDAFKAIPKSPLSGMDRLKLSIGDERGRMNYLKEKFEDVQKTRSGNLAVKDKDGMWYQIDPSGGGVGDGWTRTKEIMHDIFTDNAGDIGTMGAVLGATLAAPATGGASLVAAGSAGLGAALTRTSLGRLVGTYDATPEEQLKDVALETVLNAGGQAFTLGVKASAPVIGSMFKRAAKNLGSLPEASIDILAKTQGAITGVGEDVAQTWIRNSDEVGSALVNAGKGSVSAEAVTTNLIQQSVHHTKAIANETRTALTNWYSAGMDDIIKEAGTTFKPKVSSSIKEAFSEYAEKGFGEMMPNGQFKLKPLNELLAMQQSQGAVGAISDPKGYKLLKEFVNDVNRYAGQADQVGKDGVRQFVAFEQQLGQKIRELSLDAAENGGREVIEVLRNVKASIHNKVSSAASTSLTSTGAENQAAKKFAELQTKYSGMKDALNPILDAQTAAIRKGSSDVYVNLYNNLFKVSSLSPKGAVAKGSLDTALNQLGQYAPGLAKNVQQIAVNKAAAASLPLIKSGLVAQGAVVGGLVGGATINPALIAPAIAMSPKLNYEVAKRAGSALKGLNFLQTLDPAAKTQLFQNPEMLSKFMLTVVNTPGMKEQIKQDMLGSVMGGQPNEQ
jgi:hypothetical protein